MTMSVSWRRVRSPPAGCTCWGWWWWLSLHADGSTGTDTWECRVTVSPGVGVGVVVSELRGGIASGVDPVVDVDMHGSTLTSSGAISAMTTMGVGASMPPVGRLAANRKGKRDKMSTTAEKDRMHSRDYSITLLNHPSSPTSPYCFLPECLDPSVRTRA